MDFDPFAPAFLANPYPYYQDLRDNAPCYKMPSWDVWVVSRYNDVVSVLRNHGVFSSTGGIGIEWRKRPLMGMYDPPEHTRLRRLVQPHFTPKAVSRLKPSLEARAERLVDRLLERGKGDLAADLAVPMALGTIGDILGIAEDRHDDLKRWGDGVIEELPGGITSEARERTETLRVQFIGYLNELIREREDVRNAGDDIVSLLLHARDQERLTHSEVLAFCVLLLVAGFETTSHAITNGAIALMSNPDQWKLVTSNSSLIPGLVEEVVRYDCSIQSFFRNTTSEVKLAGTTVPPGVKVMALYGSANRDPRQFDDPDSFRVERHSDHVGFGVGIHHCLGAHVARLTMSTLAKVMAQRVRSMAVAGPIVRTQNITFRGCKELPVSISAR
jgi:cytochrome P450